MATDRHRVVQLRGQRALQRAPGRTDEVMLGAPIARIMTVTGRDDDLAHHIGGIRPDHV